jgi:lipoprotein-releasing system ATP-binding protein
MDGLRIKKLCKHYANATVLNDLSFSLNTGDSLAVMGPSGSGKSTLLNILGTLDTATSGDVEIFGTHIFSLNENALATFRARQIGFVFQLHHLLPQCSLLENVLIPSLVLPRATRGGDSTPQVRALRLLDRVGLSSRKDARPGQCSGGECQRAALVRALINAPKLLLADEPTGSLDKASASTIIRLLQELQKEEALTLIVATHSLSVATALNHTKILIDGQLQESALVSQ